MLIKKKDKFLSIVVVLVIFTAVSFAYGHYYASNDDVLMKDMLSGAYTGNPEDMNVQMLYPISFILARLYRMMPSLPVYGIFLCTCQYLSVGVIILRLITPCDRISGKIIVSATTSMVVLGIAIQYFTIVQYTVTVAFISAAVIVYCLTLPVIYKKTDDLRCYIPVFLLVGVAFTLRSEMLLLCLPYIFTALFINILVAGESFNKANVKKYCTITVMLFVELSVLFLINRIAYGDEEWKAFMDEFDSRTRLYDYQFVPGYEEHMNFYSSIGLEEADVELLEDYNYGLDDTINADVMDKVASYANEIRNEEVSERVMYALKEYLLRIVKLKDGMYTYFLIVFYLIAVIMGIAEKSIFKNNALGLVVLVLARSVSWLFIIYGGRIPDRIIHPLYLMEMTILLTCIYLKLVKKKNYKFSGIIISVSLMMLCRSVYLERNPINEQKNANFVGLQIDNYCKNRPENFYFEDVHTTIIGNRSIGEPMFETVDNSIKNYDLIGGWGVNSPLYKKKLRKYGIYNVAEDIMTKKNVFIICDDDSGTDWIRKYYLSRGRNIEVEKVDRITDDICVYRITI